MAPLCSYNPEVCDERHKAINARLNKIGTVLDGNGRPGLVARHAALESIVLPLATEVRNLRITLWKIAAMLLGSAGAYEYFTQ